MNRPLGNYERFSISRTLVGVPPALSFVANLPPQAAAPSSDAILRAISTLLTRYPLLSCAISDVRTTTPRFVQRAYSAEEVFDGTAIGGPSTTEEALLLGLEVAGKIDMEVGPLWRVLLVAGARSGAVEGEEGATLILAVNHTVSDGAGTKALLGELYSLILEPDISGKAFPGAIELAPSLEATIDVRPPLRLLLAEVFSELVLPRLPFFLQPTPVAPLFPTPLSPPYKHSTALRLATFPAELLIALKVAGAAHSIPTLQPIFHTCLLAAIVHAASTLPSPCLIKTGTPISLRSTTLGHPTATGNYISSLASSYSSLSPTSKFWTLCTDYAKRLIDPTERANALGGMGMLAYIPDGVSGDETGWETFLRGKMAAEQPWSASAGLSNLGVLDLGAERERVKVAWAQAAPSFGPAFEFNAISAKGGNFTVTLVWRDQAIADEVVDKLWTAFGTALRNVAVAREADLQLGELLTVL